MSILFTPITIGNQTFKNRIFLSPMCQYSGVDGFANDWHMVHLGSRAVGQSGLIIQEATAVSPEGRISPDDLGIWHDAHIQKLSEIVKFVHNQDTKIGIQLAHAGRKGSCASLWHGGGYLDIEHGGWENIAPSCMPFNASDTPPREMTQSDILDIINSFKSATQRSVKVGYDVIEIHAAHGYLIHQFLSPFTNKRIDNYGGDFNNRIRILLEIVEAVQSVLDSRHLLFVRISATDYIQDLPSWDIEQSIQLSKILHKMGVHLIDVSSGAIAPGIHINSGLGYQVPFAEKIKKASEIKVGAVGVIVDPHQAEGILKEQQADVILLGREMLRDPYAPIHWAQELDNKSIYPNQYIRAFRK